MPSTVVGSTLLGNGRLEVHMTAGPKGAMPVKAVRPAWGRRDHAGRHLDQYQRQWHTRRPRRLRKQIRRRRRRRPQRHGRMIRRRRRRRWERTYCVGSRRASLMPSAMAGSAGAAGRAEAPLPGPAGAACAPPGTPLTSAAAPVARARVRNALRSVLVIWFSSLLAHFEVCGAGALSESRTAGDDRASPRSRIKSSLGKLGEECDHSRPP